MDYRLIISTKEDSEFFMELFGEIKSSELLLDAWPEPLKSQLVRMQYHAFAQSTLSEFPDCIDYVIVCQSQKAGRLQLVKRANGIRVVNISLCAAFRGRGIATAILKGLITEANNLQIPVFLDVDKTNGPAFQIYRKLGFKIAQEDEIRYSLIYTALQQEP